MQKAAHWGLNSRMSAIVAAIVFIVMYICIESATLAAWVAAPFVCFTVSVRRLPDIAYALLLFVVAAVEVAIVVQAIRYPRSSTEPIAAIFVPAYAFFILNGLPLIHRLARVIRAEYRR